MRVKYAMEAEEIIKAIHVDVAMEADVSLARLAGEQGALSNCVITISGCG